MRKRLPLLLLVLLLLPLPTLVHADQLSVVPVRQAKSLWCWAACAEMVGKYEEPGSTRTQWDVVQHIKGSYADVTGKLEDSALGSQYVCHDISTFLWTRSAFSLAQIRTMINTSRNPITAGCGYYVDGKRTGGHTLVVSGIDGDELTVINPVSGTFAWVLYSDFLDGYGGRRYDQTIYTNE